VVKLRIEDIAGMILRTAKVLSEKMGKTEIKDCVITVPSTWGLE